MKNPSFPTVVWWRSRNRKRGAAAKHLAEGYGMAELVPACHTGTISLFEQAALKTALKETFGAATDRWYLAPICATCHQRFLNLNEIAVEKSLDFEML